MTFDDATNVFDRAKHSITEHLRGAISVVVNDPDFQQGYGAKSHHHNYKGGLYIHTAEVLANCMSIDSPQLNRDVLYVAAVWHDYAKVRDYKVDAEGNIQYTEHKKRIYHIAGSHANWYSYAFQLGVKLDYIDQVSHCILAHHGRPEWGSAIQPQTPEAWTLHWADCMSAWFENGKYKEKS